MFSVWPLRGFDAGCQNVCTLLEHPVGLLELAVALSFTCVSVCFPFGTPCWLVRTCCGPQLHLRFGMLPLLEHPAIVGSATCVGSPCLQTNLCVDLIGQNRSCVRPLLQASSNDLLRCCRNQFIKRPAPSVSCLISVCRLL